MTILDLLSSAAHPGVRFRFPPGHPDPVTGEHLWNQGDRAARWLAGRIPPGGTVAATLQASPDCVAALVGAWRAGLTLVSLPLRSRSQDAGHYGALISQVVASCGASMLLADPAAAGSLPDPGVPVVPYARCLEGGPGFSPPEGEGRFVQFSSGTTARPKGVQLSLRALGDNVSALLGAVAHDDPVVCSWLPLSHDMGLVGALLTGWAMGGPGYAGRAEIVLTRPETFMASPSEWLRMCGELGATATAAPTFALRLAARRSPGAATSLSPLRTLVVGAEPVDAASLRLFAAATEASGLDPRAICPAYGLAETGVAATLSPPGIPWNSITLDTGALADGRWEPSPSGTELVGLGRPLSGTEIRIDAEKGQPGEVLLRSGSMMDGYLGDDAGPSRDGWLRTGDIGYADDDLYVLGRRDDIVVVRGANLYAASLEAALREALGSRLRSPTVVAWNGGYAVVAERGTADGPGRPAGAPPLRTVLSERFGVAPNRVVIVPPRSLPRTPSGKIQRSAVRRCLTSGELPSVDDWEFNESR